MFVIIITTSFFIRLVFGKKNIKIPKDVVPEKLTLEECKKIAAEAPAKKKVVRRAKKK